ncbi:MAG: diiron oxygenase [Elusimicrobia bacterium]|nr:diiron oxygenase [Elusimicrobiota bacterium]
MGEAYTAVLEKLTRDSIRHDRDPRGRFAWPGAIGADEWLMPPELMSVHGTPQAAALDGRTLKALSKWELMNFFSLTLHGERELLAVISRHIHSDGFEAPSDFFHRFIAEENHHMWFFSEFCRRYGKIYPDSTVSVASEDLRPELEVFLSFLRVLIFEEVGDHLNIRMSHDERLPAIVRALNAAHHADESRHIAAGRQIARHLYARLGRLSPEEDAAFRDQLKEYVGFTLQSFYNPQMYADAGIRDAYGFRRELLRQPGRRGQHAVVLGRSAAFLRSSGMVLRPDELF